MKSSVFKVIMLTQGSLVVGLLVSHQLIEVGAIESASMMPVSLMTAALAASAGIFFAYKAGMFDQSTYNSGDSEVSWFENHSDQICTPSLRRATLAKATAEGAGDQLAQRLAQRDASQASLTVGELWVFLDLSRVEAGVKGGLSDSKLNVSCELKV